MNGVAQQHQHQNSAGNVCHHYQARRPTKLALQGTYFAEGVSTVSYARSACIAMIAVFALLSHEGGGPRALHAYL